MVQPSPPYMATGKTKALTIWTFVLKVMSLLFNTLSGFDTTSSKNQASFNLMAAVTICRDFGAQENSISLFPLFPNLFAMKWWDWMPWSSFFFSLFSVVVVVKLFIYFTLKHCFGFAIHWLESTMIVHVSPSWTPLPTPSPSHPSGSSQCTSPEHPVSCIEPGLAIRFTYDSLHVSIWGNGIGLHFLNAEF